MNCCERVKPTSIVDPERFDKLDLSLLFRVQAFLSNNVLPLGLSSPSALQFYLKVFCVHC